MSLIRSFFISLPDAFVASPLWTSHSRELEGILLTPDLEPTLAETIKADLADLSARAEASSEGTYDADSVEPDELEMIQVRSTSVYLTLSPNADCTGSPRSWTTSPFPLTSLAYTKRSSTSAGDDFRSPQNSASSSHGPPLQTAQARTDRTPSQRSSLSSATMSPASRVP